MARLRSRVALAKSRAVAGRLSRDAGVAGVHGPSAGCSGQSRSLGWVERARALPVRGQGFSHLDQQPQTHRVRPASFRPGERTSAMEEVVMPDRDSGLPAQPDLEYYRKQAKHLQRSYEAGDAAARARAAEMLGGRAAGRFLLSDAQFVLAQEHGFRTWA